jgi:hypothetical protein
MHKLMVTLRKVAGSEEATVETVEARPRERDLVFLVGPRAASSVDDSTRYVGTVLERASVDR